MGKKSEIEESVFEQYWSGRQRKSYDNNETRSLKIKIQLWLIHLKNRRNLNSQKSFALVCPEDKHLAITQIRI